MAGKLFIVSACSGAGKTTLVTQVVENLSSQYDISRVITYTTRAPRESDIHGRDYYFISQQEFENKIQENFFLEWSLSYGAYYGSPYFILEQLKNGKSYIIITNIEGAQALGNFIPGSILIWIETKSTEDLKRRLLQRKTEKNEEINKRLLLSYNELEIKLKYQIFTYTVLNDDFTKALSELEMIVVNELQK